MNDFANAVCLDRFHLSGNSQGASVAAQYIVDHPERVISYALVASGSLMAQLGLDGRWQSQREIPSRLQPPPMGRYERDVG